jgi:hypothetical protein
MSLIQDIKRHCCVIVKVNDLKQKQTGQQRPKIWYSKIYSISQTILNKDYCLTTKLVDRHLKDIYKLRSS